MTPALTALGQALRRQQTALTALFVGAGVPPKEAEGLLLAILTASPTAWWEQMQEANLDAELRLRVAAACRRYEKRKAGQVSRLALSEPARTRRR